MERVRELAPDDRWPELQQGVSVMRDIRTGRVLLFGEWQKDVNAIAVRCARGGCRRCLSIAARPPHGLEDFARESETAPIALANELETSLGILS